MRVLERSPLWRRIVRRVGNRLFHWAENNSDCRIACNGEAWLLEELFRDWRERSDAASLPKVVLDAGANVGDFSAAVLAKADRWKVPVRLVAFEPGVACQAKLLARFGGDPRFMLAPVALADDNAKMQFFSPSPESTHASLIQRGSIRGAGACPVDAVRLDGFLKAQAIPHVDFLKIDVEGAELKVLRGLGSLLNPDAVSMVQFEYGGTTLDAGLRLGDFFKLLEGSGYRVGKLMPRAVELRQYKPWMEHFEYGNFVALAVPGKRNTRSCI